MELLVSWRESLALLMPRQAKILLYLTFKALKELFSNPYSLLVIVLLGITTTFSQVYYPFLSLPGYFALALLAPVALSVLLTVLLILFIRPSVMPKNRFYFLSYWRHILYILAMNGALILLFTFMPSIMTLGLFIWMILSTMWILFFCDRHASLKTLGHSFIRAVLMIIYNAPAIIVITILWHALYVFFFIMVVYVTQLSGYLVFVLFSLNVIIFYPIWYCIMNTLYVKRLHDQFSLYFGRPLS